MPIYCVILAGVLALITVGDDCQAQSDTRPAAVHDAQRLAEILPAQRQLTQPDSIVFTPDPLDPSIAQTGNEHFLVFDGPDGSLMCIWTQSTGEGQPDQHIVFSRSADEGKTWDKPRLIAGPARAGEGPIASWAFPLVSRSGRIYVLYSQHVDKVDTFFHTTGRLDGIYSDDNGSTWSPPETINLPRTSRDNPDTSFPPNIICWQKPQRLAADGRYLTGITRWTSKAIFKNPGKSWTSHDSVVEFIRFDNIDDDPRVSQIRIAGLAYDETALTVPHPDYPSVSVNQEPAIVKLPDGRLFAVTRTMDGSPYWTTSNDAGGRWSSPQPLLEHDGGARLLHPLSPCPIYDLDGDAAGSGEYVLFIHNNDGHLPGVSPVQTGLNRRPIFLVRGHFDPDGKQPVRFEKPTLFMDHDGTPLGAPGTKGRVDLAMYSSLTCRDGQRIFWYPDRKFFLLGRQLEK